MSIVLLFVAITIYIVFCMSAFVYPPPIRRTYGIALRVPPGGNQVELCVGRNFGVIMVANFAWRSCTHMAATQCYVLWCQCLDMYAATVFAIDNGTHEHEYTGDWS